MMSFLFFLVLVSFELQAAAPAMQGISSGGVPGGQGGGSATYNGPIKAQAPSSAGTFFEKYAASDIKHFTTDFYDEVGNRVKRDASVRSSLRGGVRLLGGVVDGSVGVGAAKLTSEPRIFQNRSDALLQIYPVKGAIFDFLIYVNAMFPVRLQDLDPTEYMEGGRYDEDMRRAVDATIVFAGIAPKMKIDVSTVAGRITHFMTLDGRMMSYSKALIGEDSSNSSSAAAVENSSTTSDIPRLVDWAPRYAHQILTGLAYSPAFLPRLELEFAASYESRFVPSYFYNKCSKSWNYTYDVDRVSFTRLKMNAALTSDISIQAESYFLRNGFFKIDRVNNQSRFKNIFSLVVKF
jgi:hypothetical protein